MKHGDGSQSVTIQPPLQGSARCSRRSSALRNRSWRHYLKQLRNGWMRSGLTKSAKMQRETEQRSQTRSKTSALEAMLPPDLEAHVQLTEPTTFCHLRGTPGRGDKVRRAQDWEKSQDRIRSKCLGRTQCLRRPDGCFICWAQRRQEGAVATVVARQVVTRRILPSLVFWPAVHCRTSAAPRPSCPHR